MVLGRPFCELIDEENLWKIVYCRHTSFKWGMDHLLNAKYQIFDIETLSALLKSGYENGDYISVMEYVLTGESKLS